MHADRDSEQSSDVSDQDVPHNHGGCAGHCLFTPVSGTSHDLSCGVPAKFCFAASDVYARWWVGPPLRPPMACLIRSQLAAAHCEAAASLARVNHGDQQAKHVCSHVLCLVFPRLSDGPDKCVNSLSNGR